MLAVALTAVIDQTYPGPIETIVVFDQTEPDDTLVSDHAHRPVRTVRNTERTPGLAGARNTGILAATGELVAFCDDDDIWLPTKIGRQVAGLGDALTSVTGITIDYGDHRIDRVPSQDSFTLDHLIRDRIMEAHPSTVVIRRDALVGSIGLVDEEIPGSYAEDFDFIIRAAQAGPIAVIEAPLCVVRWGQSMFSRNWSVIVEAVDYLVAKHPAIRNDPKAMARLYGRRAFAEAGRGNSRAALYDAWRTFRLSPTEKRAYVTIPVALRLVSAERLLDVAHRRGRGI